MTIPTVKAPDSEIERDRLERIEAMIVEYGPGWSESYKPGSFGCHELLDRASLAADLVERSILSHPACVQNPEWFALAERAAAALQDLYQKVGQEHL